MAACASFDMALVGRLRSMAPITFSRRRLENHHQFSVDPVAGLVAESALHFLVRSRQPETRVLVVIEHGGLPVKRRMAPAAVRGAGAGSELARVAVLMASGTLRGRRPKDDAFHRELRIRWTVALLACHPAMRSGKPEGRVRMVELGDVAPGAKAVAGPTAGRGTVGSKRRHPLLELALVRILVAAPAGRVLEAEASCRSVLILIRVTLLARNREVCSAQGHAGLGVPRLREDRGTETVHCMARVAAVLVRRSGKLIVVLVPVAVRAGPEADAIQRVLPSLRVALDAGDSGVAAIEWIPGLRCASTPKVARFHPSTTWHAEHSPPSERAVN